MNLLASERTFVEQFKRNCVNLRPASLNEQFCATFEPKQQTFGSDRRRAIRSPLSLRKPPANQPKDYCTLPGLCDRMRRLAYVAVCLLVIPDCAASLRPKDSVDGSMVISSA